MSPELQEAWDQFLTEIIDNAVDKAIREVRAEQRAGRSGPDQSTVGHDSSAAPPHKDGVVYFVRSSASGLIKVGFTTNLRGRMRALASASGGAIEVLHHAPGTFADERAVHRRFAVHRKLGEWFEPAEEILDYVKSLQDGATEAA